MHEVQLGMFLVAWQPPLNTLECSDIFIAVNDLHDRIALCSMHMSCSCETDTHVVWNWDYNYLPHIYIYKQDLFTKLILVRDHQLY